MFGIISVKKLIRASVAVSVVALLFGVFSAASAQGPLGKILNRMDEHYKGMTSLKSDITWVKLDAALDDSTTQIGSINLLPKTPKRVMYARVDWEKPVENMVVIGDTYLIYRPAVKAAYKGNASQARENSKAAGPLSFIGMSKEQLKANFEIIALGDEKISGGVGTFHLQLTPKTATSYKIADVWVDGDGMIRQAKVTYKNNDTSTFLLTNIQKNTKIDAKVFKIDLKGVVPMAT